MCQFEGECIGGPLDGQRLAHWSKINALFQPLPEFVLNESTPVRSVKIGEYRLNDFGQWHWWETDVGKALRVLEQEGDHG